MLSEPKRHVYPKTEPHIPAYDFDSAKDINQQNLNLSTNDSFTFEMNDTSVNQEFEEEEDD